MRSPNECVYFTLHAGLTRFGFTGLAYRLCCLAFFRSSRLPLDSSSSQRAQTQESFLLRSFEQCRELLGSVIRRVSHERRTLNSFFSSRDIVHPLLTGHTHSQSEWFESTHRNKGGCHDRPPLSPPRFFPHSLGLRSLGVLFSHSRLNAPGSDSRLTTKTLPKKLKLDGRQQRARLGG